MTTFPLSFLSLPLSSLRSSLTSSPRSILRSVRGSAARSPSSWRRECWRKKQRPVSLWMVPIIWIIDFDLLSLSHLAPLFDNPKLDRELRSMLRERFPEFCSSPSPPTEGNTTTRTHAHRHTHTHTHPQEARIDFPPAVFLFRLQHPITSG